MLNFQNLRTQLLRIKFYVKNPTTLTLFIFNKINFSQLSRVFHYSQTKSSLMSREVYLITLTAMITQLTHKVSAEGDSPKEQAKQLLDSKQYDALITQKNTFIKNTDDFNDKAEILKYAGIAYSKTQKSDLAEKTYLIAIDTLLPIENRNEILLGNLCYNLGILQGRKNNNDVALSYHNQALTYLEKNSKDLDAIILQIKVLVAYGKILSKNQNYKKAIEVYDKAKKLQKTNAKNSEKVASLYFTLQYDFCISLKESGEIKNAAQGYEELIQEFKTKPNPTDEDKKLIAKACCNLSFLYYELKEYNNSITYGKKGLDFIKNLQKNDSIERLETNLLSNIGAAYFESSDSITAEDNFKKALRIQPNSFTTLYYYALLLIEKNDIINAEKNLNLAEIYIKDKINSGVSERYKIKLDKYMQLINTKKKNLLKIKEQTLINCCKKHPKRLEMLKELNIADVPTAFECATLSEHVYGNDNVGTSVSINEETTWKVIMRSPRSSNNYTGVAYKNDKTGVIIIAHRGTDQTDGSYASDMELFNRNMPAHQIDAINFSQVVHSHFSDNSIFYHVGHSLGGALAELCAYKEKCFAVTFDSPGVLEHIELDLGQQIDPSAFNVEAYMSYPNMVNTMGMHIGSMMRVEPLQAIAVSAGGNVMMTQFAMNFLRTLAHIFYPKSKEKAEELFANLTMTISSHDMVGLRKGFELDTGLPRTHEIIHDWPHTVNQFLRFIMFCRIQNLNTYDPRYEDFLNLKKSDIELKKIMHELIKFSYNTESPAIDRLPLSHLGPNARQAIHDYILNKSNHYNLNENLILEKCSLKIIDGKKYLIFSQGNNAVLTMQDVKRYFAFHVPEAFFNLQRKKERSFWSESATSWWNKLVDGGETSPSNRGQPKL